MPEPRPDQSRNPNGDGEPSKHVFEKATPGPDELKKLASDLNNAVEQFYDAHRITREKLNREIRF